MEFEAWYADAHRRMVTALAVASGEPHAAADAVDEACARALVRWGRVGAMGNPTGWVYRVAANELRKGLRRQRRARALPAERAGRWDPAVRDDKLWAAVRDLPPRQRHAVALRYIADLTQRDVARVMGVKPGTAAATLTAARAALREVLGRDYVDDEP